MGDATAIQQPIAGIVSVGAPMSDAWYHEWQIAREEIARLKRELLDAAQVLNIIGDRVPARVCLDGNRQVDIDYLPERWESMARGDAR